MVNLYSDTQTRPTREMRAAIADAEVGDEQRCDDPTVIALEERVAALLGHEAAVFLPSGTMCNEIAIRLHIRPGGDEILLGPRDASARASRRGGPAALSGAVMTVARRRRRACSRGDALDAALARPPGRPLRPAPAARVRRADDEHRRRPRLAARAGARRARRRARARAARRTSTARG